MTQPPDPPMPDFTDEPDVKIPALAELEQEVSPLFLAVVRKKIHRRTTVSQFASFTWDLPKVLLSELMGLLGHFLASDRPAKKREGGSL